MMKEVDFAAGLADASLVAHLYQRLCKINEQAVNNKRLRNDHDDVVLLCRVFHERPDLPYFRIRVYSVFVSCMQRMAELHVLTELLEVERLMAQPAGIDAARAEFNKAKTRDFCLGGAVPEVMAAEMMDLRDCWQQGTAYMGDLTLLAGQLTDAERRMEVEREHWLGNLANQQQRLAQLQLRSRSAARMPLFYRFEGLLSELAGAKAMLRDHYAFGQADQRFARFASIIEKSKRADRADMLQ